MKNGLFILLPLFFVACGAIQDLKEGFGLSEEIDYSQCKTYEDRAKDSNLPTSIREQAFKDLSNCRDTARQLHNSK